MFRLKSVVSYYCDTTYRQNNQVQWSEITNLICQFCGALDYAEQQKDNNLCCICIVESLDDKPSIKLNCKHSFHLQCVLTIYRINIDNFKKNGKHISFLPFSCPLCKKPMKHSKLTQKNRKLNILRHKILRKGIMRLKYDKILNEKDINKTNTTKLMDLIMNTYTYYQCNKCKQPYFGGKTECISNNIDDEQNELKLCNKCCSIKQNKAYCSIHGDVYIVWKCRFCCNVSKWYCWGSTHLCDGCHLNRNELMGLYHNEKLIQCPSVASQPTNDRDIKFKHRYLPKKVQLDCCPLGIKHEPHGIEFCLGCAVCNDL